MAIYRLYLDESGDHTYTHLDNLDRRYLGLTGIAVEVDHYRERFHPALEALKREVFHDDPDDPVILVRNKIVHREGPFGRLREPDINAQWEKGILDFISAHDFRIFTIVIDKQSHRTTYGDAAFHPYHYCLTVLVERYRGWLNFMNSKGDILAEARGDVEDKTLKRVYRDVWENGTRYRSAQEMQNALMSKDLKLKKKEDNIAGLQVADLLAYPSKEDILLGMGHTLGHERARFTRLIHEAISSMYNQYGKVLLG